MVVFVNGHLTDSIIISTGSPQGYVLLPLLFIMYRVGCRRSQEWKLFGKFSYDTASLSLHQGPALTMEIFLQILFYVVTTISLIWMHLKIKELFTDFRWNRDADRNSLNSIVKISSKIIGVKQRNLNDLYNKQIIRKAESIPAYPWLVLVGELSFFPSGWCFALPTCKTNRHAKSLIPSSVRFLNSL